MPRPKNEEVDRIMVERGCTRRQAQRILAAKSAPVKPGCAGGDDGDLSPNAHPLMKDARNEPFAGKTLRELGYVTQQEFDALTSEVQKLAAKVEKLEKGPKLVSKDYHPAIQDKGASKGRHSTLGERSASKELARRV